MKNPGFPGFFLRNFWELTSIRSLAVFCFAPHGRLPDLAFSFQSIVFASVSAATASVDLRMRV